MVRSIRLCVLALLFCGHGAVATADPIVIWLSRAVQASASAAPPFTINDFERNTGADSMSAAATASTAWSSAASAAQLISAFSLDNRHLSATSFTSVNVTSVDGISGQDGVALASAFSEVFLRFAILEPYLYRFTGSFTSSGPREGDTPSAGAEWQAYLRLAGDPYTAVFAFSENGAPGTPSEAGLLLPGTYDLFVRGDATGFAQGDASKTGIGRYDFAFDLAPVDAAVTPEPASVLLIATGLAGTWLRRRVNARSAPRR